MTPHLRVKKAKRGTILPLGWQDRSQYTRNAALHSQKRPTHTMRMLRREKMQCRLVVALAVALWNSVVEAKIYPDGACPVFTLLPFTSMYVRSGARANSEPPVPNTARYFSTWSNQSVFASLILLSRNPFLFPLLRVCECPSIPAVFVDTRSPMMLS